MKRFSILLLFILSLFSGCKKNEPNDLHVGTMWRTKASYLYYYQSFPTYHDVDIVFYFTSPTEVREALVLKDNTVISYYRRFQCEFSGNNVKIRDVTPYGSPASWRDFEISGDRMKAKSKLPSPKEHDSPVSYVKVAGSQYDVLSKNMANF